MWSSKHSASAAHIRRLCLLRLPMEGIVPALMRSLCSQTHCDAGVVLWFDAGGEIADLYVQNLPSPADTLAWFLPRPNGQAVGRRPAHGSEVIWPRRFIETCAGEERDRRSGQNDGSEPGCPHRHLCGMAAPFGGPAQRLCCAIVRDGVPFAALILHRPPTQAGFSSEERAAVKAAGRYLSLNGGTTMPVDTGAAMYRANGEQALLLCEPDGRVVKASANGYELLAQASGCPVNRRSLPDELERSGRQLIRRLLAEEARHSARDGGQAQPTVSMVNRWGLFRLRAFVDRLGLQGVLIERIEHLLVRLVAAMRHLDLSVQQGEVLLLLAQGLNHERIAERMSVSPNTADYHVRQLYAKLGAHTRNEAIADALVALEAADAA